MLVKNIMIPLKDLATIDIHDTIEHTLKVIDENNLLSLPVTDKKNFVGIISKNYIYEEYFKLNGDKEEFVQRKVSEFMKTKIDAVSMNDIVEVSAQILANQNLRFIPVVDEKEQFCGIVTHKAIFRICTKILGFGHTRLVVTTRDSKGKLARLAEVINKQGGNIISIAEIDLEVMNLREIILRVDIDNVKRLVEAITDNGFIVRRVDEFK